MGGGTVYDRTANHNDGLVRGVAPNPLGNSIRGNSIFGNGGLGIDLAGDGVTLNDPADADDGPNNLQNYPMLSFVLSGDSTVLNGTMLGMPRTTYTVDFYANITTVPNAIGNGEPIRLFQPDSDCCADYQTRWDASRFDHVVSGNDHTKPPSGSFPGRNCLRPVPR